MGVKNIIANDRLKNVALLQERVELLRHRSVQGPDDHQARRHRRRTSRTTARALLGRTPSAAKRSERFFPFYKPAIDVLRAVSYNLTTLRSAVHFMHQTLKTQRKAKSNELITLWQMFDDVVSYEEDPSGTTAGIAAISSKFNDEWKAYEAGRRIIGQATKGRLKVYASRCEKILKTLFLYHIARMQPNGLSVEEIMNCVMEWADHDKGQTKPTSRTTWTITRCSATNWPGRFPRSRRSAKNFVFSPEGAASMSRNFSRRPAAKPRTARSNSETPGITCSGWRAGRSRRRSDDDGPCPQHEVDLPGHRPCRAEGYRGRMAWSDDQGPGLHA